MPPVCGSMSVSRCPIERIPHRGAGETRSTRFLKMEDEYDLPQDNQLDQFEDISDAFANVGQGLDNDHKTAMLEYWQRAIDDIERISEDGQDNDVFKSTVLPLARIKKVMKTDSEVRMISAEAPILFAKGCDIFITELTMRAWIHAEENKRRTLQRSDIATALQKSDVFDFLIDLVPREEAQPRRPSNNQPRHYPPSQRFDMDHQIVVNGPSQSVDQQSQLNQHQDQAQSGSQLGQIPNSLVQQSGSLGIPPQQFDPRQMQMQHPAMGLNALTNAASLGNVDLNIPGMALPFDAVNLPPQMTDMRFDPQFPSSLQFQQFPYQFQTLPPEQQQQLSQQQQQIGQEAQQGEAERNESDESKNKSFVKTEQSDVSEEQRDLNNLQKETDVQTEKTA